MGLRRYVKKTERESFLVVFFVLAGLAAYLTLARGERAAGPPRPEAVAASEGMDKLWLEAALAKPDVRPVPDAGMFEPEPEAAAPAPALAFVPTPAPAPEPAPEPAPAFPTPRPAEEPLPAPRPRIAPMRDSMLGAGNSGNTSSAFLSYPKPAPPAAPASVGGAASGAAASAPRPAPKRRTMRPVTGK